MSFSVREQAIQAIKNALGDSDSPAISVYRARLSAYELTELPAYDLYAGDEKVTDDGDWGDVGSVTHTLTVTVRGIINARAQGDASGQAETVVDDSGLEPLYSFAIAELTSGDANLEGVVDNVEYLGSRTIYKPEGASILAIEMDFAVTFAVVRGDPTQKG